mgnify:CR=1 FL=1
MAEYKVAQDVEAEDKLIGPFSFRQFIYLIIAAVAVALAWGLGQIFVGLAIIPLPVIIFFTVLALPLRKDQPMEIYVAAIISYRLKPRKRVWSPDGIESLIEITVPKAVDEHLTKDLSQMETEKRLSYLADIADTKGWSIRHTTEPTPNSSMVSDQYYAAQQTVGMLDEDGSVARKFDAMISRADQERHADDGKVEAIDIVLRHDGKLERRRPIGKRIEQLPVESNLPRRRVLHTVQTFEEHTLAAAVRADDAEELLGP